MFGKLGLTGALGFVVLLAGIGVVAWQNLYIAAGLAMVLAGTGLVVKGLVGTIMRQFGLA